MHYISITVTAQLQNELRRRLEAITQAADKLIVADPAERMNVTLSGEPHGNIMLIRNLSHCDPLRLRDAAPQLLEMVRKIIKNCSDPSLRCNDVDGETLHSVRMPLCDILEAAQLIHNATGVVVEIPARLGTTEEAKT